MAAPFDLFVSCAPGLEPLLLTELRAISAIAPQVVRGGVRASGHRRVVYRANLECGVAAHVLVRVGAVVATRWDELERRVVALPWERFLAPNVARNVRATAAKSRLIHTEGIAERTARSIAVRLGDSLVASDPDGVPVQVRMDHDRAIVSIDTSGEPLHRRGYRLQTSKAPVREDIARALVIASGWDRESTLVDPFCGAGTLAIEAALHARHRVLERSFALERTPMFDARDFDAVRAAARERALPRAPGRILASDRDADAIAATTANAERAGVRDDLEIVRASVSELELGDVGSRAVIVANPPYGQRLGDRDELVPLYRALGRRAAALPSGSRVAILTSERELGMRVLPGLRTAFVTKSGGLTVRALVGTV